MRIIFAPGGRRNASALSFRGGFAVCAFRFGGIRDYTAGYSAADASLRDLLLCAVHRIRDSAELGHVLHRPVELFSSTYSVAQFFRGGFFLKKKPLGGCVFLYTNWRTAIAANKNEEEILVSPSS